MEASYRVKIEGRLLDANESFSGQPIQSDATESPHRLEGQAGEEGNRPDHPPETPLSETSSYRFSHFFKALTVDFDDSRPRNGTEQPVEWKKSESTSKSQEGLANVVADFDQLTFKRNGDENMNIKINLYRQESPERYQLSPELTEVVDMTEATQAEAVTALWEYIRLWNLQEDEEKRNFRCDDRLKRVRYRD